MNLGHTIDESKAKFSELNDEILEELRVWGEEHGISQIPDTQLAIFAHSCYYDIEASKQCMSVYYRLRATVPEFFADRDPRTDCLQFSLKALNFVSLPIPDESGNRILYHRLADDRPSSYMLNDGIKLLLMVTDATLYFNGCSPGYVFLFDMKGAKLGHLTRLSITSIRRYFEYIQDGLPVRLKAVHVLNSVWFIDKVMAIIRPFIKRELFEMLHFHTGDVSEIYDVIPPKCLPKDYGGELESIETLHANQCKQLDDLRSYFEEEERLFRGWSTNDNDKRRSSKSSNRDSPLKQSEIGGIKKSGTIDVEAVD